MARASEDELIARHFAPLAGEAALGLRDDAALLPEQPGLDLVLTVDALVAGVHFLAEDPPDTIGWKALAVNLSDLAAKGAEPAGFLLSLALPDGWTEAWLAAFCRGLADLSGEAGCPLLGGDTVRAAGPLTLSVTAFGHVPAGRMVRRTTARPGDAICITGTIGDAVLGLAALRQPRPDGAASADRDGTAFLIDRYRRPRPRNALAAALRAHATAAMDVSDGLVGDLAKMMRASGTGADLRLEDVPFSPEAARAIRQQPGLRDRLVTGGDDYEILCTLPPDRVPALRDAAAGEGIGLAQIGRVRDGSGVTVTAAGRPVSLASGSYQHF